MKTGPRTSKMYFKEVQVLMCVPLSNGYLPCLRFAIVFSRSEAPLLKKVSIEVLTKSGLDFASDLASTALIRICKHFTA